MDDPIVVFMYCERRDMCCRYLLLNKGEYTPAIDEPRDVEPFCVFFAMASPRHALMSEEQI